MNAGLMYRLYVRILFDQTQERIDDQTGLASAVIMPERQFGHSHSLHRLATMRDRVVCFT